MTLPCCGETVPTKLGRRGAATDVQGTTLLSGCLQIAGTVAGKLAEYAVLRLSD